MLKRIWNWYNCLSNRLKTSIQISGVLIGLISSIFSVVGVSLHDWTHNVINSFLFILALYVAAGLIIFFIIGQIFNDSISTSIRQTSVSIKYGNIFEEEGWRVIGCDTHFDTRVDDVVISKKSLHGQLILEHGKVEEIISVVENEAKRLRISADNNGMYNFPLGTLIRYDSSVDHKTYLMLAMTELNENYEAHTNMAKFEHMLMKMWSEISRVYASHDIVLPLLGTGISRFDDGPKDKATLLRCMLCTFNGSGVSLNSQVKVVLFGDAKDIPLYEYKDMFRFVQGK